MNKINKTSKFNNITTEGNEMKKYEHKLGTGSLFKNKFNFKTIFLSILVTSTLAIITFIYHQEYFNNKLLHLNFIFLGSLLYLIEKENFKKSIEDPETIINTLRLNDLNGEIVGFSKGGPLEKYQLREEIRDENFGLKNTIF